MIYPIIPYGDPVLRKVAKPIKLGSIDLVKLSEDMFETMYAASGVGLAAPQIGMDIRLFVVDGRPMNEDEDEEEKDPSLVNFKKVFVNATILDETGEEWGFEEGCLSIPGIRGKFLGLNMSKFIIGTSVERSMKRFLRGLRQELFSMNMIT